METWVRRVTLPWVLGGNGGGSGNMWDGEAGWWWAMVVEWCKGKKSGVSLMLLQWAGLDNTVTR